MRHGYFGGALLGHAAISALDHRVDVSEGVFIQGEAVLSGQVSRVSLLEPLDCVAILVDRKKDFRLD